MPNISLLAAQNPRPLAAAVLAAFMAATLLRLLPAWLPPLLALRLPQVSAHLDPAVVLLFAPLCALMLALMVETARVVLRHGDLPDEAPPLARAIPHWEDAAG